jgi:hypothetical protein
MRAMKERSHIDEMRAAVRGDFERSGLSLRPSRPAEAAEDEAPAEEPAAGEPAVEQPAEAPEPVAAEEPVAAAEPEPEPESAPELEPEPAAAAGEPRHGFLARLFGRR